MSTWEKHRIRRPLIIAAYVVLFWILLPVALIAPALALDLPLTAFVQLPMFSMFFGWLLCLYAGWMLIIAIRQFTRLSSELPISAFPPKHVVRTGLYAGWRHPIYLFYTLFFFGLGFLLDSAGLLLVVMPVFLLVEGIYVVWEERGLVRQFGDEYVAYRESTPLIVPHLQTVIRPLFHLLCRRLFSYTIRYPERIPPYPPFFVVANHRNYLDPFMIGTATTIPLHYVTTFEMFRSPIVGFLFRKLFCIPKKRYLADSHATRAIARAIDAKSAVMIFPEGERSWTGRFGACKPQVLKLLQHYSDVPIVPVRIDGNYHAWPRWRQGLRKAPVALTVGEPFFAGPEMSDEEIDRTIRRAVIPVDDGAVCTAQDRVEGLEKVLYRCPRCGAMDSLQKETGNSLTCPQCLLDIELTPTYGLSFQTEKCPPPSSIPEVYDVIRIRSDDIREIALPAEVESRVRMGEGESPVAFCREAIYFVEEGKKMKKQGNVLFLLTNRNVLLVHERESIVIPLHTIGSVTIESNDKLQVYQHAPAQLHQLTFGKQSALKWQDYLDETIRHVLRRSVNRT